MIKEEIIDNIARLNSQTWKDREEVRTKIGRLLSELKKALEQQPSDCKIFGNKENCFGGAAEKECNHCDYKQTAEQQSIEDCVSRKAVFETIDDCNSDGLKGIFFSYDDGERFKEYVKMLPPVTPTHGTCKDCTNYVVGALDEEICIRGHELIHKDFYCADYKKRGGEE